MEKVYLKDLHKEHIEWESEIHLAKDEVKIFESRLEEIVNRKIDREGLAELEHFQNQFIREKEVMDHLLHDIHSHEEALKDYAIENPVAIEHQHFRDHNGLREQVYQFRKIFAELKEEFHKFLSHWM